MSENERARLGFRSVLLLCSVVTTASVVATCVWLVRESLSGTRTAPTLADVEFSFSHRGDAQAMRRLCGGVSNESLAILDRRSRMIGQGMKSSVADSKAPQAAEAARLLGLLRTTDARCIDALCDNLALTEMMVGEPGPLWDLPAAQALVNIGGSEATLGLLRRMRRRMSKEEQQICAEIFKRIDDNEAVRQQMRLAEEQLRQRGTREELLNFLENAREVQASIETPTKRRQLSKQPFRSGDSRSRRLGDCSSTSNRERNHGPANAAVPSAVVRLAALTDPQPSAGHRTYPYHDCLSFTTEEALCDLAK